MNQSFSQKFESAFRKLLPSPLSLAILLTFFTLFLALTIGENKENPIQDLTKSWVNGLWNTGLLVFAFQMMLMLVLGHVLALSPPINWLIEKAIKRTKNTAQLVTVMATLTVFIGMINWGLGLIFGAILARKIADQSQKDNRPIPYPLIGAIGYLGLMVWHGGLSGSAPIKVAEAGHLANLMTGFANTSLLPDSLPLSETVFGTMNLYNTLLLFTLIPILAYFLSKKASHKIPELKFSAAPQPKQKDNPKGAEHFDASRWFGKGIGILILISQLVAIQDTPNLTSLGFITPNFINLSLLGFGFLFHRNLKRFSLAVEEAIENAAGILIQFPLYFGIMGIMKEAGLVTLIAEFFTEWSSPTTFPIFTFFSAGIINLFVPSGGGQWGLQGPIIIETCQNLNIPLSKGIMAMAYGDQLTNMLQPFWALPLLGITGLKARQILPYTLIFMILGALIFLSGLLLF